jgi:hypothetical protein
MPVRPDNEHQPDPKPIQAPPAAGGCRVERYDSRLISCLMPNPQDCIHAGFINDDAFCLHPDREEILKQALARQGN